MNDCATCLHNKKCCKGYGKIPCCYCIRTKCPDQSAKTDNYTPLTTACESCRHQAYCNGDKKYCRNWEGK